MHIPDKTFRLRDGSSVIPLHPLEKALLGVTITHLCFLSWALGTMHPWSQFCSLLLSIIGFILALLPRGIASATPGPLILKHRGLKGLTRAPLFWAGLAQLCYVITQGLNPAWSYAHNETTWWLESVKHIEWLPTGMVVPFWQAGPWRTLIIYASLWFLLCSVWSGFQRRKSFRLLLLALTINALLLALLGIFQQLTYSERIFWSYKPSSSDFISSFIYRNHAGAYFNLALATATGLAFWYQEKSTRRMDCSNPSGIFSLAAIIIAIMVIASRSRASILALMVFASISAAISMRRHFHQPNQMRTSGGRFVLILLLSIFAAVCFANLGMERTIKRFSDLAANPAAETELRATMRSATTEMLTKHWLLGWGAGCFRYGFPIYAQQFPTLCYRDTRPLFWEHAHDDLLEFPVELGVIGILPIIFTLACAAIELARRHFWKNTIALLLALASLLTLLHAWVDFVFQNPAVLLTWSILILIAIRWPQLERTRSNTTNSTI